METDLQIIGSSKQAFNHKSNGDSFFKFYQNETITGEVLKSGTDRALLLIKGRRVNVKSYVPLTSGRTIVLKVKSLSPVPVLKILGEKTTAGKTVNIPIILSAIKDNIWKLAMDAILHSNPGRKDLSKLFHLMEETIISESKNLTPELLKLLVSKAVYSLESKLKRAILEKNLSKACLDSLIESDSKGLLLKILGESKDGNRTLNRYLTSIINLQILNKNALEQSGKIFLPIPMQFPDGVINVGQLLLERMPWDEKFSEDTTIDEEEAHKATFYLELSRLGPVRSEVMICRKHIKGTILVEQRKAQEIIKDRIPFFVETLNNRGFIVSYIDCLLRDRTTVASPLLQEITGGEDNFICLVA